MMNNYLNDFSAFMILGEHEQAANLVPAIYGELIEDGMLNEELFDTELLRATLIHDYDGYIVEELAMDSLIDALVEYAIQNDLDEEVSGLYVAVRYELDLEDGTVKRDLLDYAYEGVEGVSDFLFAFALATRVEMNVFNPDRILGLTDMATREEVYETLLSQETPEFETIAENIPETADIVMVFVQKDGETDKPVSAEIVAFYEVGNYLDDIEE